MAQTEPTDHDQLSKKLVMLFFKEYLELFFPELAQRLVLDDPDFPVEFLDKEVYTDFPTGERRNLDVLGRVWTRDEHYETVLLHNENQEEDDPKDIDLSDPRTLRWLIENRNRLPLPPRMLLYTSYLQQQHFPDPVVPIVAWFKPGKGGIGLDRYDYRHFGAGLSLTYYRVCIPDLLAEEYLQKDNPLGYALAARMKRGKLTELELALTCQKRIVKAPVNRMQRDLLLEVVETYIKLSPQEKAQMESILNQPENQPIKEARLTAFGQMFMQGKQEGLKEGKQEGLKEGKQEGLKEGEQRALHQNIMDLCPVFSIRLTPVRRKHLDSLDLEGLQRVWQHLLAHHAWPK